MASFSLIASRSTAASANSEAVACGNVGDGGDRVCLAPDSGEAVTNVNGWTKAALVSVLVTARSRASASGVTVAMTIGMSRSFGGGAIVVVGARMFPPDVAGWLRFPRRTSPSACCHIRYRFSDRSPATTPWPDRKTHSGRTGFPAPALPAASRLA